MATRNKALLGMLLGGTFFTCCVVWLALTLHAAWFALSADLGAHRYSILQSAIKSWLVGGIVAFPVAVIGAILFISSLITYLRTRSRAPDVVTRTV